MPAITLSPADGTNTLPQSAGNGFNEAFQILSSNNYTGVQCRVTSNTADASRACTFLRFPSTPTDPTIVTDLHRAYLMMPLGAGSSLDDCHCDIKGRYIAAGGGRLIGAGSATNKPAYFYTNQGTTASLRVDEDNINDTFGRPWGIPDNSGDMLAIVQEIMSHPSWAPGDAITLIFMADNTAPYSGTDYRWTAANNDPTGYPSLFLEWGAPDPTVPDFDLILAPGDSTNALQDQPGFERDFTFPVAFPNITFRDAAAGESGDDALGFTFYGGDQFRGLSQNGVLNDILKERWGDAINIIQHSHSYGGLKLEHWYNDIADLTGGYWGDVTNPGSLRYTLANPVSSTQYQLLKSPLGANDLFAYGSQGYGTAGILLIGGDDDEAWETEFAPQWLDLVMNETTGLLPKYRAVLDHIFDDCVPDPAKCWVWLPGYHNIPMMSEPRGTATHLFCDSQSQQYKRSIWCMQGGGLGYSQWELDTVNDDTSGTGRGGHTELEYQSAAVQFAGDWQQKNDPAGAGGGVGSGAYNPGAASWAIPFAGPPIANTVTNFPNLGVLNAATWNYTVGSGGTAITKSGWLIGQRNVTDITINRILRFLEPMYQQLESEYDNVIYTPFWDILPASPYSADPLSTYASPTDAYSADGIHLNRAGLWAYYTNSIGPVAQITEAIPEIFGALPPFSPFRYVSEFSMRRRPGLSSGPHVGRSSIRQ